jgi:hypothetical protein
LNTPLNIVQRRHQPYAKALLEDRISVGGRGFESVTTSGAGAASHRGGDPSRHGRLIAGSAHDRRCASR